MAIGVVLLFASAPATGTGILTGTVCDSLTGEPLVGASVLVDGYELGAATDIDGRYRCAGIPRLDGAATASCLGYVDSKAPLHIVEGCSTRLDFRLYRASPASSGMHMTDSALSAYIREILLHGLHEVEIAYLGDSADSSELARNNAAKAELLREYVQDSAKTSVLEIGPGDSLTRKWLAVIPGFCYYREWQVEPAEPTPPRDTPPTRLSLHGCRRFATLIPTFEVRSMTLGYLTSEDHGNSEFVECRGTYPRYERLVLKLELLDGGTVYF
jgi:hypothetical protein